MKYFFVLSASLSFSCYFILESKKPLPRTYTMDAGNVPFLIEISDLNLDGEEDIITLNFEQKLSFFKGNGDGTFQPRQELAPTLNNSSTFELKANDFNNDNKPDILFVYPGKLDLLLGNDNFSFDEPIFTDEIPFGTNPPTDSISRSSIGDFNGDNIKDIAYQNIRYSMIEFRLGNGDGTFQPTERTPSTDFFPGKSADFNQDGIDEVVVAKRTTVPLLSIINLVTRNSDATLSTIELCQFEGFVVGFEIADVTQDGNLDILFGNSDDGGIIHILEGNSDGTFQTERVFAPFHVTSSFVVIDINGDSLSDIIIPNGRTTDVYKQTTTGEFTKEEELSIISSFVTGDFDGDGALDFASLLSEQNQLLVLLTQGTGQ